MSNDKRYFWLKLKETFFRDKEIKKLRKIAGGDTYTIIYLKLQLLSLKKQGKLGFDNLEETFESEIALELDEEVENVRMTLVYLRKCGLLEEIAKNEFMLPQAVESIGTETQGAERVRRFREKEKLLLCNAPVTKCNTEIELDIEKELDIDIIPYLEIINYLNLKANTKYKATGNKTKDCIKARHNEKFTLEDFKKVIDIKAKEWLKTEWEKYLRPETLFSNKFEGYLNQKQSFTKKEPKTQKEFGAAY